MNYWDSIKLAPIMEVDDFWRRIEEARTVSNHHRMPMHEALAIRLSLDTLDEVAQFQERFRELESAVDRPDVHEVLGGTDDEFADNIAEVIANGRHEYESLRRAPASFTSLISGYEEFAYASSEACEEPTRSKLRRKALSTIESALLESMTKRPSAAKAASRL